MSSVSKSRARGLLRPIQEFIQLEAAGSLALMFCTLVALVWANSPWAASYHNFLGLPVDIAIGNVGVKKPLLLWINDGLMALFFLVVGLEIKREFLIGELRDRRAAAVPIAAAIGGMAVPAAIFAILNLGNPTLRGWGIPMATDIAFALGVLALLGSRIPTSLKVFLAVLAIVDDLGAVLVIALFYTSQIDMGMLSLGLGFFAILVGMNFFGVKAITPFGLVGIALWYCFLKSGVHATVAGVLIAFTIPAKSQLDSDHFLKRAHRLLDAFANEPRSPKNAAVTEGQQSSLNALSQATQDVQMPLERLENLLHPWVTFGIVPVFALANAGVILSSDALKQLGSGLSLGVILGLVVGKPLGILGMVAVSTRLNLGVLPKGCNWTHLLGAGCLAGIGFTMSLFVGELAFGPGETLNGAKLGILCASLISAIVGVVILVRAPKAQTNPENQSDPA